MPADPVIIDPYSVTTIPLEMRFNEQPLSTGTAFVLNNSKDIPHLITNWHNVTGVNPLTGENMSKTGGRPDRLLAYFPDDKALWIKRGHILPLRDSEQQPKWLVHPTLGHKIDAVAMPLAELDGVQIFPINKIENDDLKLSVGQDIYILGYPFGLGPAGLPVWKRASIASEPDLYSDEQQFMLADTASRPGMSGSPVIRRSWISHHLKNGSIHMGAATATSFVGIYSGRLASGDGLDAQLGIVWPARLLLEIIEGGRRDT